MMHPLRLLPLLLALPAAAQVPLGGGGLPARPRRTAQPPEPGPDVTIVRSDTQMLSFRLALPEPTFTEVIAPDGVAWQRLVVPGVDNLDGPPGLPATPIWRTLIAVPRGAEVAVTSIVADPRGIETLSLVPWQHHSDDSACGEVDDYLDGSPPPECVYEDKPWTISDAAYGGPDTFPDALVTLAPLGELRDLRMYQVSVAAATYEPASGRLTHFSSVDVEIEFRSGEDAFLPSRAGDPFENARQAHRTVLNSAGIYRNLAQVPLDFAQIGEELLILTHPEFLGAAQALADWKNQKGIPTNVRVVADGAGPGPDTAQEIDDFIELRYATVAVRPSYLLILGDAEYVPTVYLQRIGKPAGVMIATDFPYGNTGSDTSDFLAEMVTGRISVDTAEEAARAVSRIILYESMPPTNGQIFGDPFYKRATIASGFECCRLDAIDGTSNRRFIETAEWARGALIGRGVTPDQIYGEYIDSDYLGDTTPRYYSNGTSLPSLLGPGSGFAWDGSGQDVVDAFNDHRFLVMHVSHGYPGGWGRPGFRTSDFGNLANGEYLPFVLSLNCSTGYFDMETDGEAGGYECFAERLLYEPEGGAIGVIAGTRMTNTALNDTLARGYLDALWPTFQPNFGPVIAQRRMGEILRHGKLHLFDTYGFDHWNARSHTQIYHLFGDPTLEVWTKDPNAIELPNSYEAIQQDPHFWDIRYEHDGAILTAWQDIAGETLPIGRATVVGDRATLDFFLDPQAGLPIQLSASMPGLVSQRL